MPVLNQALRMPMPAATPAPIPPNAPIFLPTQCTTMLMYPPPTHTHTAIHQTTQQHTYCPTHPNTNDTPVGSSHPNAHQYPRGSTQFLEPLLAANCGGIPVYIVGSLPASLLRRAQQLSVDASSGLLGPMRSTLVTLGMAEDVVARQLAARLLSLGVRHVDCLYSDEGSLVHQERCAALLANFRTAGGSGTSHVQARAFVPMVLAVRTMLSDVAASQAVLTLNQTAIILMDAASYSIIKEVQQLRGDMGEIHVAVFESSVEILTDIRNGVPVTYIDQHTYSQGYAAVALAAYELQSDRVLSAGLSPAASIYSSGQVGQADIAREVCRQEGFPVCGDPGVAPVSAAGCTCFNRSAVVIQVLSNAPVATPAQSLVLDAVNQAQSDFAGSTYLWETNPLSGMSLSRTLASTEAAIRNPNWTSVLFFDHYAATLSREVVDAMRRLGAATGPDRSFWILGDMDESLSTAAFLNKYLATSYVGPTKAAWASLAAHARAQMDGDNDELMLYMPIFFLPKWVQTSRAFVDGFTNFTATYPASFWRPPIQGNPANATGVFAPFYDNWVAPAGTVDPANGIPSLPGASGTNPLVSILSTTGGSEGPSMRIFPAPAASDETSAYEDALASVLHAHQGPTCRFLAIQPFPFDWDTPALEVLQRVLPDDNHTRLVSLLCTPSQYQAFAYPDSLAGGNRVEACVDWQADLVAYIAYMGAVLHQHTRERLFDGEVPSQRLITRSAPFRDRDRTTNCKLYARELAPIMRTDPPHFPVCEYSPGCGNASKPCSGRGVCHFPTSEENAKSHVGLPPAVGWCACTGGARGTLCEIEGDQGDRRTLLVALLATAGCLLGLLTLVLLWLCCRTKVGGSTSFQGLPRRKSKVFQVGWGDHVTVVLADVEGAETLWEWNPESMLQAVQLYHRVLRVLMINYNGCEAFCDADAMQFVFPDAGDALHFVLHAQAGLLEPDKVLGPSKPGGSHPPLPNAWPYRLLSHPLGQEVVGRDGTLLYRGLRVRMGVHTGIPEERTLLPNGRTECKGRMFDVARVIHSAPQAGGQVVMSIDAWAALGTASVLGDTHLVIHSLGEHRLASEVPPLQLVEVLPQSLAERSPFTPIKSLEQLSPSFFDAPAAMSHVEGIAPRDPIAIVFTFVGGMSSLKNNPSLLPATAILSKFVRRTLHKHRGYECEEKDGNFLLAFGDPLEAAAFSQELQVGAMALPWSQVLLEEEAAAEVQAHPVWDNVEGIDDGSAHAGLFIFRGLRIKIGIYWDVPTRCMPHASTGRAAYFGPLMNRAARIASTAANGQTLCNAALLQALQTTDYNEEGLLFKSLGHFSLKGLSEQMELFQIACPRTQARSFPPTQSFRRLPTGITAMGDLLARRETQDHVDIIPAWIPSGVPSFTRKSDMQSDSGSEGGGRFDPSGLLKQASGNRSTRQKMLGPLDPAIWCDTGSGRYLSRASSEWRSKGAVAKRESLGIEIKGNKRAPRLSLDSLLRVLPGRPFAVFETTMAKKISLQPPTDISGHRGPGGDGRAPAPTPNGVLKGGIRREQGGDPETGEGTHRSAPHLGEDSSSRGRTERRELRWEVEEFPEAANGVGTMGPDALEEGYDGYVIGKRMMQGSAQQQMVPSTGGSSMVPLGGGELQLQDASFHGPEGEVTLQAHMAVPVQEEGSSPGRQSHSREEELPGVHQGESTV
eukprot:jgi/Mesvir1/28155/Mv04717-RA.2